MAEDRLKGWDVGRGLYEPACEGVAQRQLRVAKSWRTVARVLDQSSTDAPSAQPM